MMEAVRASLEERDLLLYVVDATRAFHAGGRTRAEHAAQGRAAGDRGLNKIDALRAKHDLLPILEEYRKHYTFAEYLPISALKGEGIDELRAEVIGRLPEGPEYFPPDHITDQPARFLAAELIREKILLATRQEVPHATTVMIDKWEETPQTDPHLRHDLRGARRAEGDRHRREGRDAEEDRHAGARRDGSAVRYPHLSRSARQGGIATGARSRRSSMRSTGVQWPEEMKLKRIGLFPDYGAESLWRSHTAADKPHKRRLHHATACARSWRRIRWLKAAPSM